MLSISGHSWDEYPEISPRVIAANHVRLSSLNKVQYCIHRQWTLDYVFTQTGRQRLGSERAPWIKRKIGEAHLHAPGYPYWEDMRATRDHLIESAYIVFEMDQQHPFHWDTDGAESGENHAALSHMRFQDPSGRLGRLLKTLAALGRERGDDAFWEAQAMLCQAIGLLLASRPLGPDEREIPASDPATSEMDFVRRVDHYLQHNLGDRVTLEALARHLHVSPSTLSHRYREETGLSPMAALARKRVNLAKLMLIKGHSLKAIAPAAGFCDAFHLSKTFKRLEGISPSRFLAHQQSRSGR